MVDVATDVGTAGVGGGELIFRFHLAKATAAPTKVATTPATNAIYPTMAQLVVEGGVFGQQDTS